jgi:hypothetical protein
MSRTTYEATLTIPKGTTRSAPVSATLETAPGRLRLFRLVVPPGPRGEVSLWLNHQTHQLLPVPPGTYNNLDDITIVENVDLEIPTNEADFTLYGIAPNASFDHTVSFALSVESASPETLIGTAQAVISRVASFFEGD